VLTEYFPLTLIINLERRKDRRRETLRELRRHGLIHESVRFFKAHETRDHHGFKTAGAAGCFFSHLSCLREARKKNIDILILEDDVSFEPGITQIDEKLLLSKDWDILFFGYRGPETDGNEALSLVPVTENLQQTHCYAVKAQSLDKLISFLEAILKRAPGDPLGGPMHYDGALNTLRIQTQAKVFRTSMNLASQRLSETDIHEKRFWDTLPAIRPFTRAYRQIRQALISARKSPRGRQQTR